MRKLCRRIQFGTEAKKETDDTSETGMGPECPLPSSPSCRQRKGMNKRAEPWLSAREGAGWSADSLGTGICIRTHLLSTQEALTPPFHL